MPPSPCRANKNFAPRKVGLSPEQTSTFLGGKSEPRFRAFQAWCKRNTIYLIFVYKSPIYNLGPGPRISTLWDQRDRSLIVTGTWGEVRSHWSVPQKMRIEKRKPVAASVSLQQNIMYKIIYSPKERSHGGTWVWVPVFMAIFLLYSWWSRNSCQ